MATLSLREDEQGLIFSKLSLLVGVDGGRLLALHLIPLRFNDISAQIHRGKTDFDFRRLDGAFSVDVNRFHSVFLLSVDRV